MIGVTIKDDKLLTPLPADEVLKPLRRIVLDLAEKNINVTQLKLVKQQTEYISNISALEKLDLSKKGKNLRPIQGIDQSQFPSVAPIPQKKPTRPQKLPERLVVVPKTCRLNVTNNNTLEIYRELCKLKLIQFPNAIAVLLRVFMENSVDHYLETNSISLKYKPQNTTRSVYKPLKNKVQEAVIHMVTNGADKKYFDGVTRALSDVNHPLSTDLQHAYVHNRYLTPSQRDLVVAWDNAQAFFERIWA